jgi:hypothetical protein
VSPAEDSAQETHSTLVFAAGAKKIRNRAVVNQDTLGDMKALQVENERLRRELAQREVRGWRRKRRDCGRVECWQSEIICEPNG